MEQVNNVGAAGQPGRGRGPSASQPITPINQRVTWGLYNMRVLRHTNSCLSCKWQVTTDSRVWGRQHSYMRMG